MAKVLLSRLDLRNSAPLAPLTPVSLADTLSVADTGIQEVSMAASELEKARTHLGQEDWAVKNSKSMAIGGAWLVSLEGPNEEGDDEIEVVRLTLEEMDKLRSEFPDKFKRVRSR